MDDTTRYCMNCDKMRRFHKRWGFNHSICKTCGFPSLFAVKCPAGREMPDQAIIEDRRMELRFMMFGERVYL